MQPSIGEIVQYQLSEEDAASINVRRADFKAFEAGHAHPHEPGQPGATGHIAHVGNTVAAGDIFPAIVVRAWNEPPLLSLQVLLDGNDTFWATSRAGGDQPGQWWPLPPPQPELWLTSVGEVSYDEVNNRFRHHPPSPEAAAAHQRIREGGRNLAYEYVDLLPVCEEKRRALDALDDATKHANAAIARHGVVPAPTPIPGPAPGSAPQLAGKPMQ